MKKISIIILIAGLFTLLSCEKSGTEAMLSSTVAKPAVTLPANGSSLVMTKPQANDSVKFKWNAVDYGVSLGVLYTLQIDKPGRKFSKAVDVLSVNALMAGMKYSEFNSKMLALEANMDVPNQVVMRVKTAVTGTTLPVAYSDSINMTVTPYTDKDNYYVVGAFNGWNNGTAPVMNRNLSGLKYELYLNFSADNSEFKLLPKQGSWDNDMGDDPANPGKLIVTGENNMKAGTAGYYRLDVDMSTMTWVASKFTWGVIGDFNSWGGDAAMTYDSGTNTLKATITAPAAGGFKFRANGSWSLNYGDTGADGKLDSGGDNIAITSAGTYTISLNLNPTGVPQMYTYTVVKN